MQRPSNSNRTLGEQGRRGRWLVAALCAVVLAGCAAPPGPTGQTVATPPQNQPVQYDAEAGMPLAQNQDPTELHNLTAAQAVAVRADPFALSPREKMFDRDQEAARLLQEGGPMETMWEPPAPPKPAQVVEEPQPYRRVSGILVGDSVLAIVDMGDGQPAVIVHPGDQIPHTPWVVVSIDEEKVVLHRPGDVKPNDVTIRLEQAPPGGGGAAAAGGAPSGDQGNGMAGASLGPGGGGQ